jgi:multiple sugar transport system permease protein
MIAARSTRTIGNVVRIVVIGISVILIVVPIYWIIAASFMPSSDIISTALSGSIPLHPTLDNYKALLGTPGFHYLTYYANSIIIALITTALSVVFAAFGGYSLARLRFPGKSLFGNAILFTYIVPGALIVVPIYNILTTLQLVNTRTSVVICYLTFSLPFSLWMMRGYFAGLPADLEEAAYVDGAGVLRAMIRVVFPLAVPGMVAVAMFSFLLAWNEFLFALVFLNSPSVRTLPIGVMATFVGTNMSTSDWSDLMAASVLAMLPVFALFIALQRFLVEGLSMGSVK